MNTRKLITIGLDPGSFCGIAIRDAFANHYHILATLTMHQTILKLKELVDDPEYGIHTIIFEDARKVGGPACRKHNAGYVKMCCKIFQEFCDDFGIWYEAPKPKKKLDMEIVKRFISSGYIKLDVDLDAFINSFSKRKCNKKAKLAMAQHAFDALFISYNDKFDRFK